MYNQVAMAAIIFKETFVEENIQIYKRRLLKLWLTRLEGHGVAVLHVA